MLEKQVRPLNVGTSVGAGQVRKVVIGGDDGQQVCISLPAHLSKVVVLIMGTLMEEPLQRDPHSPSG